MDANTYASEGWQCPPVENRLLMFDGSLLHGVVPSVSSPTKKQPGSAAKNAEIPSENRVTIMFGWWLKDNLPCRSDAPALARNVYTNLHANMAMPVVSEPRMHASRDSRRSKRRRVTQANQRERPHGWRVYFADALTAATTTHSASEVVSGSNATVPVAPNSVPVAPNSVPGTRGDILVHCPSVWTQVGDCHLKSSCWIVSNFDCVYEFNVRFLIGQTSTAGLKMSHAQVSTSKKGTKSKKSGGKASI